MYYENISGTIYTERGEDMVYTRDEIIALYDKLESLKAVAKETGLSHSTIRQVLVIAEYTHLTKQRELTG